MLAAGVRLLRASARGRPAPPLGRGLFIGTEGTPNEDALKFKPGRAVMAPGVVVEFLTAREALQRRSPLAEDLFRIGGVRGVLLGPDFVTVTKERTAEWAHIKPAAFAALMDHLSGGGALVAPEAPPAEASGTEASGAEDEVVAMIKEILDTRVRPTVQDDGGDVQFVSFTDGVVSLRLRGACRSCASSMVTLKGGIENMLVHYIPEVKEVRQVVDDDEDAP